ncbi:hypothetical protein [Tropicimonas isoalkanivorans]|uniref:Uncharacterized protein n=1 Tax=Tropicimonas isoalkanivorans TaxID=441112 RepID=A0A1I1KCJ5_9RHOB|nr:hypothetical protein [Tropicimonas isoalkanivorans]SFC58589.1 hypothetical protein SAMN04488094_106157 [Tropicimonas isoalkanivorans]
MTGIGVCEGESVDAQVPFNIVTDWLAEELSTLAGDLDRFQHDLSDLLVEAHVSPHLMRRLQSLDGTTQALSALARVAEILQTKAADQIDGVPAEKVCKLVSLGDLRQRLLAREASSATPDSKDEGGHVSIF